MRGGWSLCLLWQLYYSWHKLQSQSGFGSSRNNREKILSEWRSRGGIIIKQESGRGPWVLVVITISNMIAASFFWFTHPHTPTPSSHDFPHDLLSKTTTQVASDETDRQQTELGIYSIPTRNERQEERADGEDEIRKEGSHLTPPTDPLSARE